MNRERYVTPEEIRLYVASTQSTLGEEMDLLLSAACTVERLREELRVTREALRQITDSHRVERLFRELVIAGYERQAQLTEGDLERMRERAMDGQAEIDRLRNAPWSHGCETDAAGRMPLCVTCPEQRGQTCMLREEAVARRAPMTVAQHCKSETE